MKIANIFLILVVMTSLGAGQDAYNARSLGMAGSNTAVAEANEYVGNNPAILAQRKYYNFELLLLSAHIMLYNNSFSLTEYDQYLTTGDSLSTDEINTLFGKIPEKGWQGNFNLGARAFSFYSRPISLTFGLVGNGSIDFPKDPLLFPFYGNTMIENFSLDGLKGEGFTAASLDFGIAFPITEWTPAEFDFFSVGMAAKYMVGIQYSNIQNATGFLATTSDYMLMDFYGESRVSEGGRGFGLDLGILGIYEKNWSLSLHFSNLVGEMYWNKNNELQVFQYVSDSLFRIEDIAKLSQLDVDTIYTIGKFRTPLPKNIVAAAAYQASPGLLLTASYRQGLNNVFGNSTVPLIAMGTEYSPIPILPLRAGIAVGGNLGFALGLGFGIDLKYWQLNVGYLNHNFHWFRNARSIDVAVATQFRL